MERDKVEPETVIKDLERIIERLKEGKHHVLSVVYMDSESEDECQTFAYGCLGCMNKIKKAITPLFEEAFKETVH